MMRDPDRERAKQDIAWAFDLPPEQLRNAVEAAITTAIRRERRVCSKIAYRVNEQTGFIISNRFSPIVTLDGKAMVNVSKEIEDALDS